MVPVKQSQKHFPRKACISYLTKYFTEMDPQGYICKYPNDLHAGMMRRRKHMATQRKAEIMWLNYIKQKEVKVFQERMTERTTERATSYLVRPKLKGFTTLAKQRERKDSLFIAHQSINSSLDKETESKDILGNSDSNND